MLVAPSPKKQRTTRGSLRSLNAQAISDCVQRLRADRDARGFIARSAGNGIAALVAHPVQQHVVHRQPVVEEGGVFAIVGNDVIDAAGERPGGAERAASCPLFCGNVPIRPERCSLNAVSSNSRQTIIC